MVVAVPGTRARRRRVRPRVHRGVLRAAAAAAGCGRGGCRAARAYARAGLQRRRRRDMHRHQGLQLPILAAVRYARAVPGGCARRLPPQRHGAGRDRSGRSARAVRTRLVREAERGADARFRRMLREAGRGAGRAPGTAPPASITRSARAVPAWGRWCRSPHRAAVARARRWPAIRAPTTALARRRPGTSRRPIFCARPAAVCAAQVSASRAQRAIASRQRPASMGPVSARSAPSQRVRRASTRWTAAPARGAVISTASAVRSGSSERARRATAAAMSRRIGHCSAAPVCTARPRASAPRTLHSGSGARPAMASSFAAGPRAVEPRRARTSGFASPSRSCASDRNSAPQMTTPRGRSRGSDGEARSRSSSTISSTC